MKPKLEEMKAEFESIDQDRISHIELVTPTVGPSDDVRTFAIIEYTESIDEITNRSKVDGDVFTMVEETATPQGDMGAFFAHVARKLLYPAQARRMGIEGKVFVEFVVETDGSISNVRAKKGIGAGCDEQAVIAVKTAPKWNPAKNKGVVVRQQLVLPITFKLSGSDFKDEAKAPANAVEEVVVAGQQPAEPK